VRESEWERVREKECVREREKRIEENPSNSGSRLSRSALSLTCEREREREREREGRCGNKTVLNKWVRGRVRVRVIQDNKLGLTYD
jgi:hypothetical protein